jgi:hypothetical protein
MSTLALQVTPHGSFKRGFDLVDLAGTPVGAFAGSVWKEGGRVQVRGQEWEFRRERGRRFVLAGPTDLAATADKPSVWSNRWVFTVGRRTYELVNPSWWSRRYELRADGQPVGGLSPRGVFDNKADVSLPADLPAPALVFVVAVAMTLWRRQAAAAGAGASAAAAS